MIAPQGLNNPDRPRLVYFAISASLNGGVREVAGSATMSTTPVDMALNMSLRSMGTGDAPHAPTIGANAAPGVKTLTPLRSARVRTGFSREVSTACETVYIKTFFTSL